MSKASSDTSRLLVLRTTRAGAPLDLWLADATFIIVTTGTNVNRSSFTDKKLQVQKINETHISLTIT
jgi:hypothetical protein